MRTMCFAVVVLASSVGGVGCSRATNGLSPAPDLAQAERWVQLDTSIYVARRTTELLPMAHLSIGLRYVNRASHTIYLPDCHGEARPPFFEKKTATGWVIAYERSNVALGCVGDGIAVKSGQTFSYLYEVAGILPNSRTEPTYYTEVPGTYRFRWFAFDSQPSKAELAVGRGPLSFEQTSKEFQIVEK